MKRVLILSLAAVLTLPLLAEKSKKTNKKAAAQPTAEATTGTAAPAAASSDSPMVKAAKRSNRLGKKATNVITNDTLKSSKGHVTTTTVQHPVNVPPPVEGPETKLAAQKIAKEKQVREIGAEEKKAADIERRAAAAEAAEDAGQYDAEDADPAQVEAAAEAAAGQKPPR